MTEKTYIFDDKFFKKYHKRNSDAILIGEDGITRTPACWSPCFWLMVKTWNDEYKRQKGPHFLKGIEAPEELLWNRYFCADLPEVEKESLKIKNIKPLDKDVGSEEEELLTYINNQFTKLGLGKLKKLPKPQERLSFLGCAYWQKDGRAELINLRALLRDCSALKDMTKQDELFVQEVLTSFDGKKNLKEINDILQKAGYNKINKIEDLQIDFTSYYWNKDMPCDFSAFIFVMDVQCKNIKFLCDVSLRGTKFLGEVLFENIHFFQKTQFFASSFREAVLFKNSCFASNTEFISTQFNKKVSFYKSEFQKDSIARFDDITCAGEFNFSNVDCHPRLFLTSANLREASLNFKGAYFRDGMNLDSIQYPKQAGDTEIHRLSWRKLRNIAASTGDAKQELDFLAYELQARQKNKKDENLSVRFIIAAYGWFSDYGRSIASPIKSFILAIFMFFIIYRFIFLCHALSAYQYENRSKITFPDTSVLVLSFYESSVFLPIPDAERYQYLKKQLFTFDCALIKEELQKEYCRPESDNPKERSYLMENAYYCYSVVASVQKLFSLLLIFLLGNSIRNHLRMR